MKQILISTIMALLFCQAFSQSQLQVQTSPEMKLYGGQVSTKRPSTPVYHEPEQARLICTSDSKFYRLTVVTNPDSNRYSVLERHGNRDYLYSVRNIQQNGYREEVGIQKADTMVIVKELIHQLELKDSMVNPLYDFLLTAISFANTIPDYYKNSPEYHQMVKELDRWGFFESHLQPKKRFPQKGKK